MLLCHPIFGLPLGIFGGVDRLVKNAKRKFVLNGLCHSSRPGVIVKTLSSGWM